MQYTEPMLQVQLQIELSVLKMLNKLVKRLVFFADVLEVPSNSIFSLRSSFETDSKWKPFSTIPITKIQKFFNLRTNI
jgi:hypothetical protein